MTEPRFVRLPLTNSERPRSTTTNNRNQSNNGINYWKESYSKYYTIKRTYPYSCSCNGWFWCRAPDTGCRTLPYYKRLTWFHLGSCSPSWLSGELGWVLCGYTGFRSAVPLVLACTGAPPMLRQPLCQLEHIAFLYSLSSASLLLCLGSLPIVRGTGEIEPAEDDDDDEEEERRRR